MGQKDWSDQEVEQIVVDYFTILISDINGFKVNKSEHRRTLIPLLDQRSDKSIEFKYRNISAVLIEMGLPFVKGFKPLFNAQRTKIQLAIRRYLNSNSSVYDLFSKFADKVPVPPISVNFDKWESSPPKSKKAIMDISAKPQLSKINYIEREQQNTELGMRGEELVVRYERHRLLLLGKPNLSERVEWVSKELGDGLGFDILSRNSDGSDRYIEVKTTKLTKETPFFFSVNELRTSIEHEERYHLCRLFNFGKNVGMYELHGRFDRFCAMQPVQYIGRPLNI